jgi:hypothetical protein
MDGKARGDVKAVEKVPPKHFRSLANEPVLQNHIRIRNVIHYLENIGSCVHFLYQVALE